MKHLIFILAATLLLACTEDMPPEPQHEGPVAVSLSFQAPQSTQTTTSEPRIADINLFLADRSNKMVRQYYAAAPTAQIVSHAGDFELFIVANLHADTGYLTYEELHNYAVALVPDPADMVLTATQPLAIAASEQTLCVPPIALYRFAARIEYRIEVAPSAGDIEVESVQALNLPARCALFGDSAPTSFDQGPLLTDMKGVFYMLPNCQGTVERITDPRQKNPDNAPRHATSLRIRARRAARILDYHVYLGDNDTSDFNVRPNTQHRLHITIRGDNALDVRIRYYTVAVSCQPTADAEQGIYMQQKPLQLNIVPSGSYNDLNLTAVLTLTSGDSDAFICNGLSKQRTFKLVNRNVLEYIPPRLNQASARLAFTVSIYDRYGLAATYDFSFQYASYKFYVYTRWYAGGHNYGNNVCGISSQDAVACIEGYTLTSKFYTVYGVDDGCTLRAEPHEGYIFDGWSLTPDHTGDINTNPLFYYYKVDGIQTIYAYFR